MSSGVRIALVAVAVLILAGGVVAAVVAGGDDGGDSSASVPSTASQSNAAGPTVAAEAPRTTESVEAEPPEPKATKITVRNGKAVGGVEKIAVPSGETVRLTVTSDKQDEIHVHGYDLYKDASPGKPARFRFKADNEGIFEIESHVSEDLGIEPLIGELEVTPG